MEENTSNEVDPPPDMPLQGAYFSEDFGPVSYSGSSGHGSDLSVEYWSKVLPNEDDDPKYWETLLTSYRHREDFLPGLRKIAQ